ncbi:MAG TPA: metalloregulator ArsR/SmtB family transcription factor [Brevundimonas sp.]|uniref:ArsR/SmtB family transcription factor n=1 Tax=Brevundimonas sp. TaxID=1871086 RepID=UPI00260C1446|nr:metalloregulator ArsR/SmtB family transcription factor [Brevundimonas sp.]HRO34001.1 metalloregulator ArsR/SmtB family transcription factor [Brevundimonas sp.]
MIELQQIGLDAFKAHADEAARLMKALSNRNRLMILCRLTDGERQVGDLAAEVGLSQSALSQHLALLRQDGLVAARRDGVAMHYAIADPAVARVIALLAEIYCPPKN